jgi:alkylation response protein AidB-like acyl-CoA dehydrogenase
VQQNLARLAGEVAAALAVSGSAADAIAQAGSFDEAVFLEAAAAKIRSAEAAAEGSAIAHQVFGAPDLTAADRRPIPNLVVEARRFSGLAVDTLVELTKDKYSCSTRYTAATALLDRGYGRPAQSLDLHLSADAITKRLSDMPPHRSCSRQLRKCRTMRVRYRTATWRSW